MSRKHAKSGEKPEVQTTEVNGELAVQDAETRPAPIDDESPEARIESLTQEVMALRQTAEEHLERARRAQAELENMRRRTARDIENAHRFALEKFITELLPVLDSLELGISATDSAEDVASLREGMDLTMKMFRTTLEKFGVKVIDPQGEKFNPEQHEAVTLQEAGDSTPGMVISVMQKGYELNGRLVRPAMVIVAK